MTLMTIKNIFDNFSESLTYNITKPWINLDPSNYFQRQIQEEIDNFLLELIIMK